MIRRSSLLDLAALILVATFGSACQGAEQETISFPVPAVEVLPMALEPPRSYEVRSGSVEPNDTIVGAMSRLDVEIATTHQIVAALDGIFDFRRSRPGDEIRVTLEDEELQLFEYRRGPVEEYRVERRDGELVGFAREFELEKEVVRVAGTIESNLWMALQKAGEDPQTALAFSDVLAWDVDFYMDPRVGDSFQFLIEKYLHDGKTVRYGDILAAEYNGELVGEKRVFRYPNPETGDLEFYAEDGSAARRAFLRSPLKFAFISSGFGSRVHPILKYRRQHQGVDYAAATGTPVWAIGDGTVTHSGWLGACGNTVILRHANGLETVYCHFSRIASGIRKGTRVAQKTVIGYVGMTGRATGPHLHYGVKRHGSYINPLTLKIPPSKPLPEDELPTFADAIAPLQAQLSDQRLASASSDPDFVGPQ